MKNEHLHVLGLRFSSQLHFYALKNLPLMFFSNCYCLGLTGLAVREHTVPNFEDIVHYLQYLKIEEPVVGE